MQVCIFFLRLPGQSRVQTFPSCFTNGHSYECVFGVMFVCRLTLLLVEEILFVYVFGARYYRRFDAWFRLGVRAEIVYNS